MSFVCNATWTMTPGKEDIVLHALAQLSPASRAEPGCLFYQAYSDPAVPNVVKIFEIYTDADAFTAHAQSEHFATWALGQAIPALDERFREIYETLDL